MTLHSLKVWVNIFLLLLIEWLMCWFPFTLTLLPLSLPQSKVSNWPRKVSSLFTFEVKCHSPKLNAVVCVIYPLENLRNAWGIFNGYYTLSPVTNAYPSTKSLMVYLPLLRSSCWLFDSCLYHSKMFVCCRVFLFFFF